MATKSNSSIDKHAVFAKLLKSLGRTFGAPQKPPALPILELMLFAICLENVEYESAVRAFERLRKCFLDWNEVRVTSLAELESVLGNLPGSDARSLRIRHLLMHVYDHQYSYVLDGMRKRTHESVNRQLSRIKHLTPFARNYVVQVGFAGHSLPFDQSMLDAAVWLGLIPVGCREDEASDLVKALVKKADGLEFCWLLKCFSVSKQFQRAWKLAAGADTQSGLDLESSNSRLAVVLSGESGANTDHVKQKKAETLVARKVTVQTPRKPVDAGSTSSKSSETNSRLAPRSRKSGN